MTVSPQLQKYLNRFDQLIEEGEYLYQGIKAIPSGLGSLSGIPTRPWTQDETKCHSQVTGWLMKYQSLLDQVLPTNSVHRKCLIEKETFWDYASQLEIYLPRLRGLRDDLANGFLLNEESLPIPSDLASFQKYFTVTFVSDLLRNLPKGFYRWTWESKSKTKGGTPRQWHIDNEYHVQSLLWFSLAPLFPDLENEPYTISIGQKQPRADLGIPSLKLIIEVKFWRVGVKVQEIIDQIATDSSLYLAKGSDYDNIVAFIWDDAQRSQNHELLVRGLKKLPGVEDAVVISRPGSWNEQWTNFSENSSSS